jgi:hypothetical protein
VAVPGARVERPAARVPAHNLEIPTYIRNQREQQPAEPARRAVGDGLSFADESMLDIPAFLRRQAD